MEKNFGKHSIILFYLFSSFVFCLVFAKTDLAQRHVSSTADVIINEILANEPGSNTKLEWVELFNADSVEHNLGGWLFASKGHITKLPRGTIIPAGGF